MPLAFKIFLVLGAMLALQSIAALLDGYKFLAYARRSWRRQPGGYLPATAVIIPVKGWEAGYEQNVRALLTQDYPQSQVIFTLASREDAAYRHLNGLLEDAAGPKIALVVGPRSTERGEKVQNLINALGAVPGATEVLAFADIDARPGLDWLRSLVGPLEDPRVTVSSGFRWYLPGNTFGARLRAAWDTSVATTLSERGPNFAWGGSMAIRRSDFERLGVAERYWAHTVSDDYAMLRAVRQAGGWIRFEPRCLVASCEESGVGTFLGWSNRQIILTRVYAPRLWWRGIGVYLLYCGTILLGLALLVAPGLSLRSRLVAAASMMAIMVLGQAKARLRSIVARERFPEAKATLDHHGSCYWTLAPLVPWVMLYNFVTAGLTRRIEWRGIRYELRSNQVRIIK